MLITRCFYRSLITVYTILWNECSDQRQSWALMTSLVFASTSTKKFLAYAFKTGHLTFFHIFWSTFRTVGNDYKVWFRVLYIESWCACHAWVLCPCSANFSTFLSIRAKNHIWKISCPQNHSFNHCKLKTLK
jgi:hypothetical protein